VLGAGLLAGAGASGLRLSGTRSPAHDPDGAAAAGARAASTQTSAGGSGFNRGWLFGGEYTPGSERAGYDDSAFTPVTLPHTVTPLSWGNWDPARWQKVWIYRRHFDGSALAGRRVFADFDGVMTDAVAVLNDQVIGSHTGGYLPWSVELTGQLTRGGNVLAVVVDAQNLPVPPSAPGCTP